MVYYGLFIQQQEYRRGHFMFKLHLWVCWGGRLCCQFQPWTVSDELKFAVERLLPEDSLVYGGNYSWATRLVAWFGLFHHLAMTGKSFLVAGTSMLAYLYTAELFPTPVEKWLAVGRSFNLARVGSISAPYIVDILGKQSAGNLSHFGVALHLLTFAMLLPETLNKKVAGNSHWRRRIWKKRQS